MAAKFGTNTGRARRCGWFDSVLVRQSVAISGIDGIALTKLDVLDGFKEMKICIGYKLGDQKCSIISRLASKIRPTSSPSMRASRAGPNPRRACARRAICPPMRSNIFARIEELIGCPAALVSTSPERDDVILMRDPFKA